MGKFVYVHGEDGSAAANIEDDLVLEDVLVLNDGVHVGARADLIFLLFGRRVSKKRKAVCVGATKRRAWRGRGEKRNIPTSPRGCL